MNIVETGFRIKQAIGLTGYSVKDFCEKTNRSRSTTALWIAGRGGIIKDNSLDDLCIDLKKCSVYCDTYWLKHGKGSPPTLYLKSSINPKQAKLELNNLKLNLEDLCSYLEKFDDSYFFDVNNNNFYLIGEYVDTKHISSILENIFVVINNTDDIIHVGYTRGYCETTNQLVISTENKKFVCIEKSKIKQLGKVKVFIKK